MQDDRSFNHHMLIDDTHRVLFCFAPKVGCTNLKLLFFVNQGEVPHSELSKERDDVDQQLLQKMVNQHSLDFVEDEDKKRILNTYFKFTMWRNPLERLASSYRSKVERYPLFGLEDNKPPYNWLRKYICRQYQPKLYKRWIKNEGKDSISISFGDFINYWLNPVNAMRPEWKYDDHFMPQMSLCRPCKAKFDFYGNFNHFDRDAKVLIDKIGANSSDLRTGYYNDDIPTNERMKKYYGSLSARQKRDVLEKLDDDLQFFYSLFPEEEGSHLQIMQLGKYKV